MKNILNYALVALVLLSTNELMLLFPPIPIKAKFLVPRTYQFKNTI